jgi:hypothetical protein
MAKGSGTYDYSGFRDRLRKEYEQGQSGGDTFVLKDRAIVRILPYSDERGEPCLYREAPVHFGLAKFPISCGQGTSQGCLICEAVRDAGASGDADDMKWANSVSARRRFLFNIVNMELPPEQRKVQVLSATYTLKQAILSYYTDVEYERALFLEGRDFILTRKGTGLDTEYAAKVRMDATEFDDALAQEVFDLDQYVQVDDAETQAAYLGFRAPGGQPAPDTAAPPVASPRPSGAAPAPGRGRGRGPAPEPTGDTSPPQGDPFPEEDGPPIDPVTGEPLDIREPPPDTRRRAPAAAPPSRGRAPAAAAGPPRGRAPATGRRR